jgi:hypothetical protein
MVVETSDPAIHYFPHNLLANGTPLPAGANLIILPYTPLSDPIASVH